VLKSSGNTCSTCGGSAQSCCGAGSTGTCDTGLVCSGRDTATSAAGTCGACGGTDQLCCPTGGGPGAADSGVTACTSPQECVLAASGNVCATCGGSGQSCCGTGGTGTCTTGLACSGRSRTNGTPGTCGTPSPVDGGSRDVPFSE
jgi:hypothetical protein